MTLLALFLWLHNGHFQSPTLLDYETCKPLELFPESVFRGSTEMGRRAPKLRDSIPWARVPEGNGWQGENQLSPRVHISSLGLWVQCDCHACSVLTLSNHEPKPTSLTFFLSLIAIWKVSNKNRQVHGKTPITRNRI